jgi:hypothetical protein
MPIMRHFTSKSRGLALVLVASVAVVGCSGPSLEMPQVSMPEFKMPSLRLNTKVEEKLIAEEPVVASTSKVEPATEIMPTMRSSILPIEQSHWCEAIREDDSAQAVIMRSPNVSGSLNDNGQANLGLGMSVSGYLKADLLEESSEIKCRRYLADAGLRKIVFLAPQGLTAAGHKAKADTINKKRKEIQSLKGEIKSLVVQGYMTRDYATSLLVQADQLIAEEGNARSQSERRMDALTSKSQSTKVLAYELLRAEAELEDINSRMRTLDAFDVSLSGGWSDDINNRGVNTNSEAFSGKVSFSMKLGAVDPRRFEHERRAKEARLRAIAKEEGGSLWQVDVLRSAHERAIAGLVESEIKLDEALVKAKSLISDLRSVPNPEFKPVYVAARLQLINLQGEKAAIKGSIAEIRSNIKKLK